MAQPRELKQSVGIGSGALTDVLAVEFALLGAVGIRFGIEVPTDDFLLLLAAAPIFVLGIFAAAHLYQAFRLAPAEEFRRLVFAVSASLGVIMLDSFWLRANLSRAWVGTSWALALLFTLAGRRMWHARFGRLRERGVLGFPTLVVGENEEASRLLSTMARPAFGFRPVGVAAPSGVGARRGVP